MPGKTDTRKIIERARSSRTLYLSPSERLLYFGYEFFGFLTGLFCISPYILDFFQTGGFYSLSSIEIIGLCFMGASVVCGLVRLTTLRFTAIETSLPHNELAGLFRELADHYRMVSVTLTKDVVVLEFKPETHLHKTQRVTIVFYERGVLFNSIKKPEDVLARHKLPTDGSNRLNLDIFREEIADLEREHRGKADA